VIGYSCSLRSLLFRLGMSRSISVMLEKLLVDLYTQRYLFRANTKMLKHISLPHRLRGRVGIAFMSPKSTRFLICLFLHSGKHCPNAASTLSFLRPGESRTQSGTVAESEAFPTCSSPKELIDAYGSPADDLSPKVNASTTGAPIIVATADISMITEPKWSMTLSLSAIYKSDRQ
jgi:hypothetical protein